MTPKVKRQFRGPRIAQAGPGQIQFTGHTISLSRQDLRAIEVMQQLGHGRIECVPVREGSLIFSKQVKILRAVDLLHVRGSQSPIKPWLGRRPHRRHEELLAECRLIVTGVMDHIEIADGLPMSWRDRTYRKRGKP